jgi:hypothetical protein
MHSGYALWLGVDLHRVFPAEAKAKTMSQFWRQYGGPFINEYGDYQHGVWCSGGPYTPRRAGDTCSCYRSDLWYRRLGLVFDRQAKTVKRTLWVSICPGCGWRREFPFADEPIPRETYCQRCWAWAKVEAVSWDGEDFAWLLPTLPRRSTRHS